MTGVQTYALPICEGVDRSDQSVVAEGSRMPASVIKIKQRNAAMSDKDFAQAHKDKSEDELRAMAWRHGYGKDSSHYVDRRKKGQQGVSEEVEKTIYKIGDRVRHEDGTLGTVTQGTDKFGMVQWKHAAGKNRVSDHSALKHAGDELHRWRRKKRRCVRRS